MELRKGTKRKTTEAADPTKHKDKQHNSFSPHYISIDPFEAYKDHFIVPSWKQYGSIPIHKVSMIFVNEKKGIEEPCLDEDAPVPRGMKRVWKIFARDSNKKVKPWLVDLDDYQRLTCASDAYVESLSDKDGKGMRNLEFVHLLATYPRMGREIVVLDSPAALTTNVLHTVRQCFGFQKIHVPNLDARFLEHASPDFSTKATFYHASVYEWMRDLDEDDDVTYDFALDYCCTFYVSGAQNPKADLTLMFQKGLLAKHNGCLWMTFSTRSPGNSIDKTKKEVPEWMHATAQHFGYTLVLEKMGNYGKGMCYFFFRTCQQ
jgi:hypothetical protein